MSLIECKVSIWWGVIDILGWERFVDLPEKNLTEKCIMLVHKNDVFSLRISSVNVTKSVNVTADLVIFTEET